MPHFDPPDDIYSSNSHFLSASAASTSRKSPSRQNLSARRSSASLRPSSLAHSLGDEYEESVNGRHHSLAHELAVALMPEPSAGSKLLAEEFGIEFGDDAEGVEEVSDLQTQSSEEHALVADSERVPSFASELAASTGGDALVHDLPPDLDKPLHEDEYDPVFHTPAVAWKQKPQNKPEQDAMEILAQDLESTDKFLNHLRMMDVDSSLSSQPTLERLALDVIRRINISARDRESHVRELLEYEREFKKIAGEVGGGDILGHLDELTHLEDLSDVPPRSVPELSRTENRILEILDEEPRSPTGLHHSHASDWELDPDRRLGDDDEVSEPPLSPMKDSFLSAPLVQGPATPASAVPQLNHLRSFTTSLVSSLTTISEQAQVNGAATTEAGRKIRALKNKLGGWRTEWDSAERSRIKIERWEAGITDADASDVPLSPSTPSRSTLKRIDGRRIVEEHLRAFELALADASLKTQAIMAR